MSLSDLDRYLGDFSASAPTHSPAQNNLALVLVGKTQEISNLLGSKLVADGNYGPKTRDAWQAAAVKRRLNPAYDRRSKTEVWVHPDTYRAMSQEAYAKAPMKTSPAAKVTAKTAPAKTAPEKVAAKPAPAKPAAVAPGSTGTSDIPVLELQKILQRLGWTSKKLTVDGSYGPQTANAWMSSAKLRKLDGSIARVSGTTARVTSATYAALKAAKPATAATVAAAAPAAAPAVAAAAGTSDIAVNELQRVLYFVGWTTKKLKADGSYGPKTAAAWAYSSKLRKLDPMFARVDGKTARVSSNTYAMLAGTSAPAASATPPSAEAATAPSGTFVSQSVLAAQRILRALGGWGKITADGSYGPKTAAAWASSSKQRGLDPTFARVDAKTARVSADTFSQLQALGQARLRPLVPPRPRPQPSAAPAQPSSIDQAFLKAFMQVYTAPVLVSDVQKMLIASRKYPAVQVTGTWDAATQAAFLNATFKAEEQRTQFTSALPQLLLQGGTSILLAPDQAKVIALGASLYAQQQAGAQQAPSSITATAMPQLPAEAGPSPVPGMPGTYATSGAYATPGMPGMPGAPGVPGMPGAQSAYDSSGGGGITPVAVGTDAGAPAPTDAGAAAPAAAASADTWQSAVQTLGQLGGDAKKYADALEAAQKRGDLHPDVKAAVVAWGASAEALKGHLAQVIDASAPLKAAIEAAGPGAGLAGFAGFGLSHMALEARFGDVGGFGVVAEKVLDALKSPLPLTVGGKALAGFSGLRGFNGLGIIEWVVKIGEVVWPKLVQLLGTRAVTVAGAAAVAASGANDIINGDVKAYQDHNAALAQMVSDGKLTVDEYNALKAQAPGGSTSNVGWLIGGAVGLGALAIYLRSKAATAGSRRTAS
jgi:peptidoglycan hydrolase-like protein with peptidoglycan-binding domain